VAAVGRDSSSSPSPQAWVHGKLTGPFEGWSSGVMASRFLKPPRGKREPSPGFPNPTPPFFGTSGLTGRQVLAA